MAWWCVLGCASTPDILRENRFTCRTDRGDLQRPSKILAAFFIPDPRPVQRFQFDLT